MTFTEFAFRMFPYWCMGGFMFWAIWKSEYKDVLRFEWKTFAKFFAFILVLTVYRVWMIRFMLNHGVNMGHMAAAKSLPIGAVFMTPWEDLCFSVPLVLLRRILGTSKWMMPVHWLLTVFTMIAFFSGHVYQGYWSAAIIAFYIPWAVGFIQKRGAGTLMLSHVLYDFSTMMAIRIALGG
jgi:hypothetical protein